MKITTKTIELYNLAVYDDA